MPARYHFNLVDTDRVTDAGGAILDHDDQARRIVPDQFRPRVPHTLREVLRR